MKNPSWLSQLYLSLPSTENLRMLLYLHFAHVCAACTCDMSFTGVQVLGHVTKKQGLWKAKEQALILEYKYLHLLVKI